MFNSTDAPWADANGDIVLDQVAHQTVRGQRGARESEAKVNNTENENDGKDLTCVSRPRCKAVLSMPVNVGCAYAYK